MSQADAADRFAGRRVLVTGASGFIGSHLCASLVEAGAEVHGAARGPGADADPAVRWHRADLAEHAVAEGLVRQVAPEVIYHLAGAVTGVRDPDQVVPVFRATLASTVHVLDAARRHGTRRVVLAGSMEEPTSAPLPIPTSPYAAAKWAGGGYGRMFASLYDIEVAELRIFMTYGPGPLPEAKLVPAIVLGLLRGDPPTLGSGRRRVDWVFIDDVVRALRLAAFAELAPGTRPEIGSGRLISTREFATMLARHVDPSAQLEFGTQGDRSTEVEAAAEVDTARRLLGWTPQIDLDDGLARVVAWYRQRLQC